MIIIIYNRMFIFEKLLPSVVIDITLIYSYASFTITAGINLIFTWKANVFLIKNYTG